MGHTRPNLLSIAGCDPSGGAGIAADLKTFATHQVYGMAVVTALTAQNTRGVFAVHQPDVQFLERQLTAVLDDVKVHGVKIGMVGNIAAIGCIAYQLKMRAVPHIVLDPVLVATSGDALSEPGVAAALCRDLLPLSEIITPNGPEVAALTGLPMPRSEAEQVAAGQALLAMGARAVLVKGGHSEGDEAVDVLVRAGDVRRFAAPRLALSSTHGTGCTLSSALAAGLAQGMALEAAVERAKAYVYGAIAHSAALDVGLGHGPLDHGWMMDRPSH